MSSSAQPRYIISRDKRDALTRLAGEAFSSPMTPSRVSTARAVICCRRVVVWARASRRATLSTVWK